MTEIALIFPGQGAQKVGMGKELYESSPEAKAVFDKAETLIGDGFKKIVFEGPQESLTLTKYCQPAILTMSVAAFEAFRVSPKFKEFNVRFAAGLSLGEYSALAAANVLSFEDTLKLVGKRASFMEEAAKLNKGGMAAVIGFDAGKLKDICAQTGAEVANFNSKEQIVITGHAAKVTAACEAIKAASGKVIPLEVSGAFHSTLMKPAALQFQSAMNEVPLSVSGPVQVISNVNAQPHLKEAEVRANLVSQITSSVQWVASIEYMMDKGVVNFIEIGPGKVLRGLIRKINPAAKVCNIEKPEDIPAVAF